NRAALRLVGTSSAAMLVLALILLGFATVLSERIRRMRDSAERAVDHDGRVREALPAPRAKDEIGDLGRTMASLLRRLKAHQSYLRTLADKLAHELRTPLAMIRSSLDNLEHAHSPEDIERYRRRANEGSERLNRIFQAMSQAARIEESLRLEERISFDLVAFLDHYATACGETYPERKFRLFKRARQARLDGSPELFAQMLDKLIDNAVDFSPKHSRIDIRLSRTGDQIAIEIENEGPTLPDAVVDQLFDSMVSVRSQPSDGVHLGLGLYIARLIVEHHNGRITASNGRRGCCIRMVFPVSRQWQDSPQKG
ncbi:MAG: ATP-binding protein, partial [Wenzhouxiangella sp.]|nr:ATP-binding protein [Wenzhouxiangella sp.]